jgi:chromosome segregation ATPase
MGLLAFLGASRLKTELTRQRDEIARLHQMLDMEVVQRQDLEKHSRENDRKVRELDQECQGLKEKLKNREKSTQEERATLKKEVEAARQKALDESSEALRSAEERIVALEEEAATSRQKALEESAQALHTAEGRIAVLQREAEAARQKALDESAQALRDSEIRVSTLRHEVDERQRQRAEIAAENQKLEERAEQLQLRLNEMAQSLQDCASRGKELDNEKAVLQRDLDKIMGNLNRW